MLLATFAALYFVNASWAAHPSGALTILAHRGPHQRFHREGIVDDGCTASQSLPITHGWLENTIPSIEAAFRMGADMVEFDIHPTTDGEFAVFHDWWVDCRTNGKGVTRDQSMAFLRTVDIAYGYTADGGKTFPLRGQGVGMIPTMEEVLRRFPGKRFLVNIKSNVPEEGDLIADYLQGRGLDHRRLSFYGGARPGARLAQRLPDADVISLGQSKDCEIAYLARGWLGLTPESCRGVFVAVPLNLRHLFWGWPHRFLERMQKVGATVYLAGEVDFQRMSVHGLDDPDQVAKVPKGWRGGVMTDRIETVGPALKPGP